MGIHFDTMELAISHLLANGWTPRRLLPNGVYISADKTCRARIVKVGPTVVMVLAEDIW